MIRTDYRSLLKGYSRVAYYVENFSKYILPDAVYRWFLLWKLHRLTEKERLVMNSRTNYYVRLDDKAYVEEGTSVQVRDFKYPFRQKHKYVTYFFDLYESIRCFSPELRFRYIFGDINYEVASPAFVKSRPIALGTTNSVVCRLNKVRHFRFIKDPNRFQDKQNQIVFRNVVKNQPHRTRFLELYVGHPMCDVGQINNDVQARPEFVKPYIGMEELLNYKFIACIEGNDVATNLKWVMSSNSLAVMPRPKIESWFMEGQLVGGYHYVEIKDDYSDLIEKMNYYIEHPQEAETIIAHAHEYVNGFRNETLEQCIQYQVVRQYFDRTHSSK